MKILCKLGLHWWCYMKTDAIRRGRWCRRCGKVQMSYDGGAFGDWGTVEVKRYRRIQGTFRMNRREP